MPWWGSGGPSCASSFLRVPLYLPCCHTCNCTLYTCLPPAACHFCTACLQHPAAAIIYADGCDDNSAAIPACTATCHLFCLPSPAIASYSYTCRTDSWTFTVSTACLTTCRAFCLIPVPACDSCSATFCPATYLLPVIYLFFCTLWDY